MASPTWRAAPPARPTVRSHRAPRRPTVHLVAAGLAAVGVAAAWPVVSGARALLEAVR